MFQAFRGPKALYEKIGSLCIKCWEYEPHSRPTMADVKVMVTSLRRTQPTIVLSTSHHAPKQHQPTVGDSFERRRTRVISRGEIELLEAGAF